MCLPLFFLGLCGHAHVAFIEFSHYTFTKESCRKYSPLGLHWRFVQSIGGWGAACLHILYLLCWKLGRFTVRAERCVSYTTLSRLCRRNRQDNINSTQFPQDLEMWSMLCVHFLCKILMNSFQSSPKWAVFFFFFLNCLRILLYQWKKLDLALQLVRFEFSHCCHCSWACADALLTV